MSWYVTHLSKFMTHGSIINYIQAIVLAHKFWGLPPPTVSSSSMKLTLAGVKRVGKKPSHSRDPITLKILIKMYNSLNLDRRKCIRFWACCLLLFRSLLRVSHVVASPHTLRVEDIVFDRRGMLINVKSSKTSTTTRAIPISCCQDTRLCAVYWVKKWLSVCSLSKLDYLFPARPGLPLSYCYFSAELSSIVSHARIKENITSHSFRHGGASFLSELGVPLSKIKDRGGWKSNAVYCYLSDSIESKWLVDHKVSTMVNYFSSTVNGI